MASSTLVRVLWRDHSADCFDDRLLGDTLDDLVFVLPTQLRDEVEAAEGYPKIAEWVLAQMVDASACGGYEDQESDPSSGELQRRTGDDDSLVIIENFGTGDSFRLRLVLRGDEVTCSKEHE